MKAIILAGGEGSRLRPLTLSRPKSMLQIVNRPILGHILYWLKQYGISEAVMALHYLAAQIQDYFGDGKALGMKIDYVIEESPLGTAGSVKQAGARLDDIESFLVISGDTLSDINLTALIQFHRERKAALTMALCRIPDPLEHGVVNLHDDGRIAQFLDKPTWGAVTSDTVSTGIYVVQPEVLTRIPSGRYANWSQDIFPKMLAEGEAFYGYVADGYWCDIGTLGEYQRANADLLNGRISLGELGQLIGPGIWAGGPVTIAPDVQIFGPVYLGEEVIIKPEVVVHGPAVIRDYTILDNRARIDRSIIWRNCYIGEGVEAHGAVVGRQCTLKARSIVFEGAVVGDNNVVGEDAVIMPGVKLWPNKEVENGATVHHSIIWGQGGRRTLFGPWGVTGLINIDLTSEFVTELAASYASILPKGGLVTLSTDQSPTSRILVRSISASLAASGLRVLELGLLPAPVGRYFTRTIDTSGGVLVSISPFDRRVTDVAFLDPSGLNVNRDTERAIERAFFQQDVRRVFLDDIGRIDNSPEASEVYARGFMGAINVSAIREAKFKLVVDLASSAAAGLLPGFLEKLGCEVIALNADIDEHSASMLHEELRDAKRRLQAISSAVRADLGIRIDSRGDKLFVIDDTGSYVPEPIMCAAMAAMIFRAYSASVVAVTVDQPLVYEELAKHYGGLVRRCPMDLHRLMQVASEDNVTIAGNGKGNFIFPAFQPAIDGLFALGKLLELLAIHNRSLSAEIAGLPPVYTATDHVHIPWEMKGRVMRLLVEQFSKFRHDMVDGLKVFTSESEWVLFHPSGDWPTFMLVTEGRSLEAAQDMLADYSGLVRTLAQGGDSDDKPR